MAVFIKTFVCIIFTVNVGCASAMPPPHILQLLDMLESGSGPDFLTEPICGNGLDCTRERTCEGSTLSISCSSGSVINVTSANYGRTTGSEICPHISIHNTACYASNSLDIVSNLCNGQRSCSVSASNYVFGDPCVGTYKYLEVDYTCESESEPGDFETEPICGNGLDCTRERTCEGTALSISCSSGSVINVTSANYGRTTGSELCPHNSIHNTACYASNSLDIVSNLCNGQSSCSVSASNSIFSDPCVGTYKYLEVDYTCESGSEPGDFEAEPICGNGLDCTRERTCEGTALSISCSSGSVINVTSANYGRTTGSELCPHNNIHNTACYASNSLDIVSNLCNGQSSCSVSASNYVFSDPCVGTYKYLEVDYTCESESEPGDFETEPICGNGLECTRERTCEGTALSISCTSGSVINVTSANYGRTTGSELCPHNNIHNTACYASNSLDIVSNLCNGQSSCSVSASNYVFSDPCVGTYKYLEVDYTCESGSEPGDFETEPICGNVLDCTRKRTCEGSTLSISCSSGSVINVISANYGRTTGAELCPHISIHNTACYASNSLDIVSNLCNGQSTCSVSGSNSVFSDPCVGTYKYLEVDYTCESEPADFETQPTSCGNGLNCTIERTCEGRSINLSCPPETPVIVISRAIYGRQVPGSDFCPHRRIHTTECAAPSSLTTVRSACEGRSSCTVAASNQIFSDPCVGTYKYLEIEYTCARRDRACEHSMLDIGCPSGLKIVVLDALYGRMTGPDVCPHTQISDQNCRALSSLRVVEDKCNGLSSCTVTASNGVFGDPCWSTVKYLEVLYECM